MSSDKLGKKIDIAKTNITENLGYFRCPLCKEDFSEIKDYSMICHQGHNFNINKKGYVHLLTHPHKTIYDQSLFHSRQFVYEAGVYDPFIKEMRKIIQKFDMKGPILDAGCGEGYFLNNIGHDFSSIGIDISKEGIVIAAQTNLKTIWAVGDLANLPVADHHIGTLLNILTPANYEEFKRTLQPTGYLVKVIPGEGYLKEIRSLLEGKIKNSAHSTGEVIEKFSNNFKLIHKSDIKYTVVMNDLLWSHTIKMTPLTSSLSIETLNDLEKNPPKSLTIELSILLGTV